MSAPDDFRLEADAEEEEPEKYADRLRTCPRCGRKFLSIARKTRPMGIPLFCESCDEINGNLLREREARWMEIQRKRWDAEVEEKRNRPKRARKTAKVKPEPLARAPEPPQEPDEALLGVADDLLFGCAQIVPSGSPGRKSSKK